MKLHYLFCVMLPLSMMFSACDSDEPPNGKDGNDTVTEGPAPSAEFTLNDLPDEPYAEDAIRIVAANENESPFYSLELMPDGTYLLCTARPYASYAPSVSVKAEADGSISMFKPRKSKAVRTRSAANENETLDMGYGTEYGKFTKLGNKKIPPQ